MKWKVVFIPSPPHVLVEFEGEFDLGDALNLHEHLAADEHVLAGSPILMDARNLATPKISSDDIDAVARSIAKHSESFSNTRIAIYVASDVHFGLGRQLQGFMGEGSSVLSLLRSEDDVTEWLAD